MPSPSRNELPELVAWRDGVQIAGTVVWCDARRARDLCFLSHAAHAARSTRRATHGKVLSTARTLELLAARGAAPRGETLVTPLRRPFFLGAARLELFPSGRLPGAASLLVEANERRVVYAGEIRAGAGLAEAMEVRGADAVVIDAPLAALSGQLPPPSVARAELVAAVRRALDDGRVPLVLAAPLGAAEEAIDALSSDGIALSAHAAIVRTVAAYRGLGLALPSLKRFRKPSPGEAIVWPIDLRNAPAALAIAGARRIAATGLAIDEEAARKLRVDQAVALSDGADLDQVIDYVAHTGARAVYFTAGFSARAAAALAARRVKIVQPLGPPRQMDLFR